MRLERTPDKREVTGSTPVRPTVFSGQIRPALRAIRLSVGEVIPVQTGVRPTGNEIQHAFWSALPQHQN